MRRDLQSWLIGLVQVLAVEFGHRGIRVNALLPGGTDPPMGRAVASTPEALAFVQGLHALKRMQLQRSKRASSFIWLLTHRVLRPVRHCLLIEPREKWHQVCFPR